MTCDCVGRIDCLTKKIKAWAEKNGVNTLSTRTELLKVVEEVGEISSALSRNRRDEVIDAIGDVYISLVNFATSSGVDIADCIECAYEAIKDREGVILDDNFIKSEDM